MTTRGSGEAEKVLPESGMVSASELCRVCRLGQDVLVEWVSEGVLEPTVERSEWYFSARQVHRARTASRLQRDLELSLVGLPLVLDLLEEVQQLRVELAVLRRQIEE